MQYASNLFSARNHQIVKDILCNQIMSSANVRVLLRVALHAPQNLDLRQPSLELSDLAFCIMPEFSLSFPVLHVSRGTVS
jgi:hypothetical protein